MQQPLIKKYQKSSSAPPLHSSISSSSPTISKGYWQSASSLLVLVSLIPGYIIQLVQNQSDLSENNQDWINRGGTHLLILLLTILAISLSNISLSRDRIGAIRPLKFSQAGSVASSVTTEKETPLTLPAQLSNLESDVLVRAAVPHTIIPERSRPEITTYVVQPGDTIFGIAAKFGLTAETIMWANSTIEDNPDWLRVGQELIILPLNGVYHQVGGGDTIAGIAATYKTDPEAIINYPLNKLNPDEPGLEPGQWLVVPGGTKPFVPRKVTAYSGPVSVDATTGTGIFGWPASGSIFQGYWSGHPAIDIASWAGAPINAADSGNVVFAGWDDTGYGYTVVIDHGNGFQSLYAHLQAYYVAPGENVTKGQQIGEMGSTGNSTGPHLHFEVRQGTIQRNPVGFLP